MGQKGVFETSQHLSRVREQIFTETCQQAKPSEGEEFSYAKAIRLAGGAYEQYREKIEQESSTLSESMVALDATQKAAFKADLIERIKGLYPIKSSKDHEKKVGAVSTAALSLDKKQGWKLGLRRWVWNHIKSS